MKLVMCGFEFTICFGPTTETRIRYFDLVRKIGHIRCRMFHDSTWVPTNEHVQPPGVYRWFCCRDCKTTWVSPITGHGDKV
jgi:hypothetical protein